MKALQMPTNDLAFGLYPQRATTGPAPAWETLIEFATSRPDRYAELPPEFSLAFDSEAISCNGLGTDELLDHIGRLGSRLRRDGLCPRLVGQAAATIAELMFRQIGQRPFKQQVIAAWHLLSGQLVEMQTGEGKSLAAGLAAVIGASAGASVFVLTANDYLVARDQELLAPVFSAIGLTTAAITNESVPQIRPQLWRADIVYSTAQELGFDYLRDHSRTKGQRDPAWQRASQIAGSEVADAPILPGLCFCIVDEADALLLDEAGVPLILAIYQGSLDVPAYRRVFSLAETLHEGRDFQVDLSRRRARLTPQGLERIEAALGHRDGILALWQRAVELVETAVCARVIFKRDRDYAVHNEALALIDEFTGRIAAGRQWQGALQAMVEIKEGLEPRAPTEATAKITFQALFPRFLRLSGMSGTVADSHRELKTVYGLSVVNVPLRLPSENIDLGRRVLATSEDKVLTCIATVKANQAAGRPVLVATDSVIDSAELSIRLKRAGVVHQVLNAVDCEDEASVIRRAGRASVVTVTTNLAGRGTDIRLSEVARRNGGLSVIATMANRSRRIDRQLFGRAGRQGDPGSFQSIVSLQDRLVANAMPALARRFFCWLHQTTRGRPAPFFRWLVRLCQSLQEWRDQSVRTGLRRLNRERTTQLGFSGLAE